MNAWATIGTCAAIAAIFTALGIIIWDSTRGKK